MKDMQQPQPEINANDLTRFTEVWLQAQPIVASYIKSGVRNFHDAEDLIQEVAMAAAASFSKYDPNSPFINWAMGIARNHILKYYRTQSRSQHVLDNDVLENLAAAFEMVPQEEMSRARHLPTCLEQLTAKGRRLIEMRYTRDMKPEKIAQRTGSTTNAVSLALSRIRKFLGDCIRAQEAMENR